MDFSAEPLTIFGEHDEGTVAQMHRCLAVGGLRGVLCADGHKGYAQPIGGVLAYRGLISISGVGFDIGCFTGDTQIFTLDGKTPTLRNVAGQEVWVLGCDDKGVPKPAKGICLKTRHNASLVGVTLDNGKRIRCTPDHLFMLRDGTYKHACELVSGQSLMPFYKTKDEDGYVLVRNNATGVLARLHWIVFRAGLTKPAPELNGDKLVLHHSNFIRQDNSPQNVVPMTKTEHDLMHAAMRNKAHFNEPDFQEKRIAGIKQFWVSARQDSEFMDRRAQAAASNLCKYMHERPEKFKEAVKDNGKRGAVYLRRYNTDPTTAKRNQERAAIPTPCPICETLMIGTSSLYFHALKEHPEALAAGTRKGRSRGKNSVGERLLLGVNNHKVVSVENITDQEDVFCLSVPGVNNFALADGVFVHNCGNLAIRTDAKLADIRPKIGAIMDDVARDISFGMGLKSKTRIDHELFSDPTWEAVKPLQALKETAASQLGTVGGGNHYVDIFADENDAVWVGAHFGSRGFGHKTATYFLREAGGKDGMDVAPTVVRDTDPLGQDYLASMTLAGRYAYAGREAVARHVVKKILWAHIKEEVHNHHNFAWQEEHGGEKLWVVRKGATPAFPGQRGFIGGSMGDDAVIVEGVDGERSRAALYSTVHGAGRIMSRTAAKGKFVAGPDGRKVRQDGLVRQEEMARWLRDKGVELRGGDLDEAPQAYRRLPSVLAAHGETIRVLHTLRPLGVVMAGRDVRDPYKD